MLRQRRPAVESSPVDAQTPVPACEKGTTPSAKMHAEPEAGEGAPLLPQQPEANGGVDDKQDEDGGSFGTMSALRQNQWMVLALGSGACAAFNGVFAKLYVRLFRSWRSTVLARRGGV